MAGNSSIDSVVRITVETRVGCPIVPAKVADLVLPPNQRTVANATREGC